MKILELRFKNLNSLKGEWLIDFSDPAYTDNSLFAITGPTGSGKSTILDALCLAIYGCTPRLKTLSKSTNEIMTRHTGECYAEAVFETHSGTYRCHWSQHRARKKADGKLADSRHEISDYPSGDNLLNKKKETALAVEERTGMDFDRFTRSILLAQGSFASFLKADVSERADVLEQITGTGIYSEISKKVHEKRREAEELLNNMKAAVSGIELLDVEEKTALSEKLTDLEEKDRIGKNQENKLSESINWLKQLNMLEHELKNIENDRILLDSEQAESKEDRKKLKQSMLASEMEADYVQVTNLRQHLHSDSEKLEKVKKTQPLLTENIQKNKLRLNTASEQLDKTREQGNKTLETIKQTRTLDLQIKERNRNLAAQELNIKTSEKSINNSNTEQQKLEQSLLNLKKTYKETSSVIKENQSHEILETELAGIRELIQQINRISQQITLKYSTIRKFASEICQAEGHLHEQESAFIEVKEKHNKIMTAGLVLNKKLSELLEGRDLNTLKNDREITQNKLNLLREIASLEDRRTRLIEGNPCPLCGSEHHPFAVSETPESEETESFLNLLSEKIKSAESLAGKIFENEKKRHNSELMLKDIESLKLQWEIKQKESGENSKNTIMEKEQLEKEITENKKRISDVLKTLGIISEDQDYLLLLNKLEQMRDKRRENLKYLETLTLEIQNRESEKQNLLGSFGSMKTTLEKDRSILKNLIIEITELKEKRTVLFENKHCDREEEKVKAALFQCEKEEKTVSESLSFAVKKEEQARLQSEELDERTAKQKSDLKGRQKIFAKEAEKRGFSDEHSFHICRMKPEERQRLSEKLADLDNRLTSLQARQQDRIDKIETEKNKKLTEESEESLRIKQQETALDLKNLREETGALRQKLEADKDAQNKLKEKAGEIEKQNKEYLTWNNLHVLIGSADGQKFQKFAQGLTFETMISHANKQLEKMTDRYLLLRDESQPLELNVVDNYQAGEIRSTKNLSGGESFIVSLALALGLSSMASRKVRVDSLFLDEGFGTLDEQALETALETLAGLQQEGKLIGVISHVLALKENIGTRITVNPGSGGCSKLSGPGVSQSLKVETVDKDSKKKVLHKNDKKNQDTDDEAENDEDSKDQGLFSF